MIDSENSRWLDSDITTVTDNNHHILDVVYIMCVTCILLIMGVGVGEIPATFTALVVKSLSVWTLLLPFTCG